MLVVVSLYGESLTAVHDAAFGALADAAGRWLLRTLARRGLSTGAIVELGCGAGVIAARLVAAGRHVVACDVSPAMIARAERRAPGARLEVASAFDLPLPRVAAAVVAVGEVLGYLADGETVAEHDARLEALFARVARSLRPGGLFAFDLAGPGRAGARGTRVRTVGGDGWTVRARSTERDGVLTRAIETRVGGRARRELHRLRLHAPEAILASLRAHGFVARRARGYGAQQPVDGGWALFVATRR
jgi:SAM-dependent methyltransferase